MRRPGKSRLWLMWVLREYIWGLVTENLTQTTERPPFKRSLVSLVCR